MIIILKNFWRIFMSIKSAADIVYTFRFLRMLVMKWEEFDAYKLGLIDNKGNRIKSEKLNTNEKRDAWTPFIRLVVNIKRLMQKVPGGGSRLASFVAALYLIRENFGVKEKHLHKILEKIGVDTLDLMNEGTEWFILNDGTLAPGIYTLKDEAILNSTFESLAQRKDKIRILENSFPVGSLFGIDLYEAIHMKTKQTIYVTASGIVK